jgi:hypothetical protein
METSWGCRCTIQFKSTWIKFTYLFQNISRGSYSTLLGESETYIRIRIRGTAAQNAARAMQKIEARQKSQRAWRRTLDTRVL